MVCGIVALPLSCCCFPIGLILGGVAIALGIISRRDIAASGGVQSGGGMALAGLILGGIAIVLGAGVGIFYVISLVAGGTTHSFSPVIPSQ